MSLVVCEQGEVFVNLSAELPVPAVYPAIGEVPLPITTVSLLFNLFLKKDSSVKSLLKGYSSRQLTSSSGSKVQSIKEVTIIIK